LLQFANHLLQFAKHLLQLANHLLYVSHRHAVSGHSVRGVGPSLSTVPTMKMVDW
jgi:hypothetical protein